MQDAWMIGHVPGETAGCHPFFEFADFSRLTAT